MFLSLALLVSLSPQEPHPGGLAAHLESLGLQQQARELARPLGRPPGSRRAARLRSPEFLRRLQEGGQPLLDPALELVSLPDDGTLGLAEVQDVLHRLLGARPRRLRPARAMDPRRFRALLQDVNQELHRALGREAERNERRGSLQAWLERMRGAGGREAGHGEDLRRQLEHLETVDLVELQRLSAVVLQAALSLQRPEVLDRLRRQSTRKAARDVVGDILWDWDTAFGRFVVGGFGTNIYECTQVDVIVDLGGDDVYRGPAGATTDFRRLGIVVDLEGNDRYDARNDGLGSATYGLGMLVDLAGNDHYSAMARSAGFGLGGFGMLVDVEGDDRLELGHHSGGVGVAGVGVFVDLAGSDDHLAAGGSFGLGLAGGVGLCVDTDGNDRHELGGQQPQDPEGTSFGLGTGLGLVAELAGGIGMFLDARGDDVYQAGGLTLGAGSQGGLGMFFDLAGDDSYRSGSGSLGSGHHFGKGLFFEAGGQDDYAVTGGFGLGAATQAGEAWFADLDGDDYYRLDGPGLGQAQVPAMAGFLDLAGRDRYLKTAGTGAPWPAFGPRYGIEGALSLFLDEGNEPNHYAWAVPPGPRPDEVRREEVPDGRRVSLTVLADR